MKAIDWNGLNAAQVDAAFGSDSCLTIYLCGAPEDHLRMRPNLVDLKATNLRDEEYGFVYAKVPVALTKHDIEGKIARVRKFAEDADIEIDIIDLDASADIERTKFYTLWTSS